MGKSVLTLVLLAVCIGAAASPVFASSDTLFYASATLVPYPASGEWGWGYGIGGGPEARDVFVGVRFSVAAPTTITAIGGQFVTSPQGIFGAIVRMSSFTDFPDSKDLSSADVLRTVTFEAYSVNNQIPDLKVPIAPLDVMPGIYAVVFGSGYFGKTGQGFIPHGAETIDNPSYFYRWYTFPVAGWSDSASPIRLTVYTVPEPNGLPWCASTLLAGMWARVRAKRMGEHPE